MSALEDADGGAPFTAPLVELFWFSILRCLQQLLGSVKKDLSGGVSSQSIETNVLVELAQTTHLELFKQHS